MHDRTTITERMAGSCPRFPLPACDIETGRENTAEATIVLEEIDLDFGLIRALVTIEGRPEEWSIASVEVPTDIRAFSTYAASKSPIYRRTDWEMVDDARSHVEREIWRGAKAAITEDMARDALCRATGE